jgi:hypothetical protein
VGRLLNGSLWPTILGTDTAASKSVSKRVITLSWVSTLSLLFLGIVAVITPLGLGDNISAHGRQAVDFAYARDLSPVGIGTLPRSDYVQNRLCGLNKANCPGSYHGWTFYSNATDNYAQNDTADAWISTENPSNVTNIFGSSLSGNKNTIAGPLDIQYRSFVVAADEQTSALSPGPRYNVDQGKPRAQGRFQAYDSFVLKDRYDVVEGLMVDSKSGGIGFRNHTIPMSPGLGVEWTESLLFIEPESACIDTNITLEYSISSRYQADRPMLVDRGGFVDLTRGYPFIDLNDTQARPELVGRAWKGASINNFNLMFYFNETRSTARLGKSYPLTSSSISGINRLQVGVFPTMPRPFIPGVTLATTTNYSNLQTDYIETGKQNKTTQSTVFTDSSQVQPQEDGPKATRRT